MWKQLLNNKGLTLVELMITSIVLAVVLAAVNGIFFSSNRVYREASTRANMQMNSRLGLSIMTREIRHAGCDPNEIGVVGIVQARADRLRIRGDLNGDGAIQTAEPSEDVTYFYDAATNSIMRDPGAGAQLLIPNVTAASFTYLDAANNPLGPLPLSAAQADQVRSIDVSLTAAVPDAGDITLDTSIKLRNR